MIVLISNNGTSLSSNDFKITCFSVESSSKRKTSTLFNTTVKGLLANKGLIDSNNFTYKLKLLNYIKIKFIYIRQLQIQLSNILPVLLNYDRIVPIYRKNKVQLLVNVRAQLSLAFLSHFVLQADDPECQVYQLFAILNIYNPYDQHIRTLL